jgi:hypothetical protein
LSFPAHLQIRRGFSFPAHLCCFSFIALIFYVASFTA